jgi:hypothetical protein
MTPEAVEAVLEAPAKRSRRDPVKKTPVKSVKKATPPAKKSRYLEPVIEQNNYYHFVKEFYINLIDIQFCYRYYLLIYKY